jgi:hypothetical protein
MGCARMFSLDVRDPHWPHAAYPWVHHGTMGRSEVNRTLIDIACTHYDPWPPWLDELSKLMSIPSVRLLRIDFHHGKSESFESYWVGQCPECQRIYWMDLDRSQP